MKIERNGIKYELTAQELWTAYCEQQHLNDISDIDLNLEDNLPEDQIETAKNNEDFLDAADWILRSNLDDLGMDFDLAVSKAIEEAYDEFNFSTDDEE